MTSPDWTLDTPSGVPVNTRSPGAKRSKVDPDSFHRRICIWIRIDIVRWARSRYLDFLLCFGSIFIAEPDPSILYIRIQIPGFFIVGYPVLSLLRYFCTTYIFLLIEHLMLRNVVPFFKCIFLTEAAKDPDPNCNFI